MSEQQQCRQCGTCCRKGGPALHREDARLLTEGVLQLQDLCTFRAGELVRDTSNDHVVPLPEEIVKIAAPFGSRPDDWTCRFLMEDNRCFIHGSHPAECRALFCEDPKALLSMQGEDRLDRAAILELLHAPQWLADSVKAHEEHCNYAALTDIASRLESEEEARRALVQVVEYDRAFRDLMMEKGKVRKEMLDFLFGRPLMHTVIMFGIDARHTADGGITLVQTTRATLKR
ncbi:YkgJ family cysteine cluster protein [Mailhella massiliensis]|uniref:YkgJ family cysteine cluster protein n=1 Tax=Mailhella massiliensis TaxID=1903261 RepID=UPI00097D72CC|nr:YkgJ family cysteine cluster protein [Mailhella massiliensis]